LTKFERISKVAAADRTQPPHYLKAQPSASQKVGSNIPPKAEQRKTQKF